MDKSKSGTQKKGRKSGKPDWKWIVTIFGATVVISTCFSLLSSSLLEDSGILSALLILLAIICIGIVFDIVGVAVTAAEEKPLHSMAARKVPGAQEAIALLKHADRVASFCNDVVGDICGVISGSASAVIAVQLIQQFELTVESVCNVALSAMVAGLTVGGKAIGKSIAMHHSVSIVHLVGRVAAMVRHPLRRKSQNKKKK